MNSIHKACEQELVEAYSWVEVASLSELESHLQFVVPAGFEVFGNRLCARRDEARAQATRIVADMRARVPRDASPPMQSPASNQRLSFACSRRTNRPIESKQ